MSESLELEQLRELIELFPSEFKPSEVAEANRIARTRYEALDNSFIPDVQNHLENQNISLSQKICFSLCSFFHYQIFNQIISIAGEFRQTEHKGNGMVYFGGYQQTEMKHQFRGANPADIKSHLKEAFEYLLQQPNSNALENSLHFYQRFVKISSFL